MAASIPVLRTLARELSTGKAGYSGGAGYFRSTSKDDRNRKSRATRPGTNVVTVSTHGHAVSPDTASDKSILDGRNKIVKTEEITVDFRDRGGETGMGYELHGIDGGRRHRGFD